MSATFTEAPTIKLEETGENVTEIQSYLAGFQKEIVESTIQPGSGKAFIRVFHLIKYFHFNIISIVGNY